MPLSELTIIQESAVSNWLHQKIADGVTVRLVNSEAHKTVLIDEYFIAPRGSLIFYTDLEDRGHLNRIIYSNNVADMLARDNVLKVSSPLFHLNQNRGSITS